MADKCWSEMYVAIREFWGIINPVIESTAKTLKIPADLYYFGELGLRYFSRADFEERDRFSNPELFDELFQRLSLAGWIRRVEPNRYEVTQEAREAARKITQSGYDHLATLDLLPNKDEKRLVALLGNIVQACSDASEPPRKRAFLRRFRVATQESPPIVQIREYLMDLFAYRDDVHLASWEVYPVTGIMWNTFSLLWSETAASATAMAEQMAFRGFEADHYQKALEDLCKIGWVEKNMTEGFFRMTHEGKELRDEVELETDVAFYKPWSILSNRQIKDLCKLVSKLNISLSVH